MKVHLINDRGEINVVEARDFNTSQQEGDGKYVGWYIDIDWYLANGYKTLEETRKIIEGQMANVCVLDITGKLDGYVTPEEFMERTSYLDEKNLMISKGILINKEISYGLERSQFMR